MPTSIEHLLDQGVLSGQYAMSRLGQVWCRVGAIQMRRFLGKVEIVVVAGLIATGLIASVVSCVPR